MASRVVVITGGYGRLGQCFARAFVGADDQVILTGRDKDRLQVTAQRCGCADTCVLDVCDRQQVGHVAEWLNDQYGRVDVLINNAARMGVSGHLADIDADAFSEMVHTNICGAMFCTQALLPLLRKSANALVLNVASTSGHRADPTSAAYNASKFGLMGFTEAIRKDLRSQGIRVSSLSPSSIAFDEQPTGGKGARLHGDDIAAMALHLAGLPARALVRDVEFWATDP